MANTPQSKKRARQSEKHRMRNASQRGAMRTYIKVVVKAIQQGKKTEAASEYRKATSVVDKMVKKGIIHQNAAARYKGRLNAHIKGMA